MNKKQIGYIISCLLVLFVAVNTYVIANEGYWTLLIPFALIIIFLAIFRVYSLLAFVAFLTPLSTTLGELGLHNPLGVEMSLPTEPLLFGLMIIAWVKMFSYLGLFRGLYLHPISWCIAIYIFWIFFTSLSSSMPLVSFKLFVTRMWFVSSFYVLAYSSFQDRQKVHVFVKCYLFGLSIVAIYTLIQHAIMGFEHDAAHWVMSPFFKDHTSYGMSLALIFPFAIYLYRWSETFNQKLLFGFCLLLILIGIIFSYTRAAWLSLIAATVVYIFIKLRVRFSVLFAAVILVVSFLFVFQTELLVVLEKNSQDSSDSFTEHFHSISNVSTDASNLERINRWKSAIRLFRERPHLGWGIGTYQFNYAPYQNYYDKSIISTNSGNKGNAHSEYLSMLAETGWPGLLIFIVFLVVLFTRAIGLYGKLADKKDKALVMTCILSLVTYFSHAVLNNFLDMDKASVPLWGFISIIVMMDVKERSKLENKKRSI